MDWVLANLDTIFKIIFGIIGVASVICAATPTPNDDKFLGKLYKLMEIIAINFGYAKDIPQNHKEDNK